MYAKANTMTIAKETSFKNTAVAYHDNAEPLLTTKRQLYCNDETG